MGVSEMGSVTSAEAMGVIDARSMARVRANTRMRFIFLFLLIFHRLVARMDSAQQASIGSARRISSSMAFSAFTPAASVSFQFAALLERVVSVAGIPRYFR